MAIIKCTCGGSFDDHNLCFECDRPKPTKAEQNSANQAKFRKRRKAEGLIMVQGIWATPANAIRIKDYAQKLN